MSRFQWELAVDTCQTMTNSPGTQQKTLSHLLDTGKKLSTVHLAIMNNMNRSDYANDLYSKRSTTGYIYTYYK